MEIVVIYQSTFTSYLCSMPVILSPLSNLSLKIIYFNKILIILLDVPYLFTLEIWLYPHIYCFIWCNTDKHDLSLTSGTFINDSIRIKFMWRNSKYRASTALSTFKFWSSATLFSSYHSHLGGAHQTPPMAIGHI